MQSIWQKFLSLYQVLQKDDLSDIDIDEYGAFITLCVQEFAAVYQTRHITPYVHAFANHVPEFLKLHGSL